MIAGPTPALWRPARHRTATPRPGAVARISPPRTARHGHPDRCGEGEGRAAGIQPPPAARSCAEDRSRPTGLTGPQPRTMRTGAWTPCGRHPQAAPSARIRRRGPLGRARATRTPPAGGCTYTHRGWMLGRSCPGMRERAGTRIAGESMPNGAGVSRGRGRPASRTGFDTGAVAIRTVRSGTTGAGREPRPLARHQGTKLAREGADRWAVHGRTVLRRAAARVGFASNRARRWRRGDPRLPHPWRPRLASKDHTAVCAMESRAWRTIWSRSSARRCVGCPVRGRATPRRRFSERVSMPSLLHADGYEWLRRRRSVRDLLQRGEPGRRGHLRPGMIGHPAPAASGGGRDRRRGLHSL